MINIVFITNSISTILAVNTYPSVNVYVFRKQIGVRKIGRSIDVGDVIFCIQIISGIEITVIEIVCTNIEINIQFIFKKSLIGIKI